LIQVNRSRLSIVRVASEGAAIFFGCGFIAFAATMTDPEFVTDVRRSKLDLEPVDGAGLTELIAKIYATPKPIVERVSNLIK